MAQRFTVTAALPYSNGQLHVGHIAGCYLPADIFVRFMRSRGRQVAFICGSDDYGVPVALTARKQGKSPREVSEYYRAQQLQDFKGIGIEFDIYSGTCAIELHTEMSQHFFLAALEHGHLEKRATEQLFDPKEQMFLPDRYVEGQCHHCGADGARGDQCEACGRPIEPVKLINPRSVVSGATPEVRRTVHWFFRLSRFGDRLRDWIESHTEWRQMVRNFTLGILGQTPPDRSITRDLQWGVPVPLPDDPDAANKVLYVWFDAPVGYVSFTAQWCQQQGKDWQEYERWWKDPDCRIVHFIGEDNVVFHAMIWPAMLMAEGTFQLPSFIAANCFLNIQFPGEDEQKMSTSRGSAIWINEYLREYEPDPLRYYLTMIAPETQRTTFRLENLIRRNNDELVATLGNFVHRTMTFAHRVFDGRVPAPGTPTTRDSEQLERMAALPQQIAKDIEAYQFKAGLQKLMAAAQESNRYFDHREPWMKRKENIEECATIINVALNTIKVMAVVAEPYLPFAAGKIAGMLSVEPEEMRWDVAAAPLPEGRALGEARILFNKIETPQQPEA